LWKNFDEKEQEYNISLKHGNFYEKCVRLTILKIWFVGVFFAVFLSDFAQCAQITGPQITLVHASLPSDNGTCPNNTYKITISDTMKSYMLFVEGMKKCPSGYVKTGFNGLTMGSNGTFTHNTENHTNCTRTGYYDIPSLQATTYSKMSGKSCIGGTAYTYRPDNPPQIVPASEGTVTGTAVALCENGYLNNGTCTVYSKGNCPDDYLNMALNTNTITALNNSNCNSGYTKTEIESPCIGSRTTTSTCVSLCNVGYEYTSTGACANIQCPYGTGMLESGIGRSFQMYTGKQTTPTLVSRFGADKCYINLAPGVATGNAINIRTNGTTYHVTD